MKKITFRVRAFAVSLLISYGFLIPQFAFAALVSQKTTLPNYSYSLSIPSIGVGAGVLPMGKTSAGKMAVPNNFKDVGWFSLGSAPGEKGNAVLGAHVDNGGKISGVFKRLKELKQGNVIALKGADGKLLQYRVSQVSVYDRNAKDTTAVFSEVGASRLVLITCHGAWLPKLNTYASRLVVFADLVQS